MLQRLTILFVAVVNVRACGTRTETISSNDWWKTTAFYQIYPRSFKDSDGDGVGDLNGITSRLEHLADAGVGAFWISPIYPSPMADWGYDVSNFTDVDPTFGTLDDFDRLVTKAKTLGLKVILDFVPNHSSDRHEWFDKSVRRVDPYTDYYIWHDGREGPNGTNLPPNNWLSGVLGSAWEWNEERSQYYYHIFGKGQPDLNYRNENVRREMRDVLSFWLKRGVDGFRIDAINQMFENEELEDEPPSNEENATAGSYNSLNHTFTCDLNETYSVLQSWRELLDEYSEVTNTASKVILSEAWARIDLVMKYYTYGSNLPFNFEFIFYAGKDSTAVELKNLIYQWLDNMPENYVANWVIGNHDHRRVASRFGTDRADQMTVLCSILPGIVVTYYGDEIGMLDGEISWEESVDPLACNSDRDHYELYTRDPARTPFQWDNSTSAGFSSKNETWLPVNENYMSLNLEAQKAAGHSHYRVYQAMMELRKLDILQRGSLIVEVLGDNVLAVVRTVTGASPIIALLNCDRTSRIVNVTDELDEMIVYTSSVASDIVPGSRISTKNYQLQSAATVVLTSEKLYNIVKGRVP
ncbi:maltase 2-like [Athalia rosae]|uniref:maltase 2-like n=1 Tax=Athalia rosae TaxID=37344 RepID=UPI002033DB62|nr:maltase 2-like [Athalia rosae]